MSKDPARSFTHTNERPESEPPVRSAKQHQLTEEEKLRFQNIQLRKQILEMHARELKRDESIISLEIKSRLELPSNAAMRVNIESGQVTVEAKPVNGKAETMGEETIQ